MKLVAGIMSSSHTEFAVASSAQAVRWLASGQRSSTRDAANISAFLGAGGCQMLLTALTTFAADSGTCYHLLDALVSLCLHDPFCFAWVEAGGLPVLISVMDAQAGNSPAQDRCCWALVNLALYIPNSIKIVTLGGLPRIYAALSGCNESAAVQHSGCRALASLATEDANEEAILASGGLLYIYAALDRHILDDEVQMEGCAALGNLAGQDPSKLLIANSGGVQRTVSALVAHIEHAASPVLAEQCCLTIANITAVDDPHAVTVGPRDIECLCTAMRKWPAVATLQSEACRAIHNISVHGLPLLQSGSVIELLEAAALLQDEECNYWANAALAPLRQRSK